ncbi:TetR/AcrR family transcriptional regulator [Amycolatopsis sp. K13G38]|uniref:TetR/AcrR family transcriptional regulator n=1 Tax=Amycolatopsis acididurans TaxID=2724524 RepID=A0ABX1JAQ3_9PSEU|nr:TetR/AcrR family transcriptional regulator [Amycolatopsis acididurans]
MPDVRHFDPDVAVAQVVPLLWRRGWSRTGMEEIVAATGLSRSSLYATFGSKDELCLSALRRYLADHADPAFRQLETDGRGLPAVAAFFGQLIAVRCSGPRARWGCLATNLQVAAEGTNPGVREVLGEHHQHLVTGLAAALRAAEQGGQLRDDVVIDASAEHLALLAQGVNLRSRAGADPSTLRSAVDAALGVLRHPASPATTWPEASPA